MQGDVLRTASSTLSMPGLVVRDAKLRRAAAVAQDKSRHAWWGRYQLLSTGLPDLTAYVHLNLAH